MKSSNPNRKLLFIAIGVLTLSIILAVISLSPMPQAGTQTLTLVNDSFTLTPNETYRQGLGLFQSGENISISINPSNPVPENFSIITDNGTQYSTFSQGSIDYNFTTAPNYYEAVLLSNSTRASTLNFEATVQQEKTAFPYRWLTEPSRALFIISACLTMVLILQRMFSKSSEKPSKTFKLPSLSKRNHTLLVVLLFLSLVFWLFLLSANTSPLGTLQNWYTDHARDSYVSSLFLKDGFSVFNQPLTKLANSDDSVYKFVTWPQMPNLYPLGSIFLFLPFGVLLQNGVTPILIYKIEIGLFLAIATVCLYYFLKVFLKKDLDLGFKLLGIFIIYTTLVIYAAVGMFDSVAFLFVTLALSMFLTKHYDYFFLLATVATFFKYQAGIFLLPLIIFGLIKLYQADKFNGMLKNKAVVVGALFGFVSIFTASLSAPYLITIGPQLIMNGVDAFAPNALISWSLQSFSILLTLGVTIAYAVYMMNKNSLLSLTAIFMLLPSFMLPYFQYWYLPFVFVYVLIPQQKRELEITFLWLGFMMVVLAYSGANYSFLPNLHSLSPFFKAILTRSI